MDFYFLLFLLAIFLLLVIYFLRVVLKPDKVILLERIIAKAENADWKETCRNREGGTVETVRLETKIGPYKVVLFWKAELGLGRYTLYCKEKGETIIKSDDVWKECNDRTKKRIYRKLERLFDKANETEKKRLKQEEAELREKKREAEKIKRYKKLFKK